MFTRRPLARDLLGLLFLYGAPCPPTRLHTLLRQAGATPSRPSLSMAIRRLRERRLVIRRHGLAGGPFVLTRRGRMRIAAPREAATPRAPQGLHYFVTYDIPVKMNDVRDQFRGALRQHGWRRLHASLWIAERDIRDTAVEAAEELGIDGCVFVGTGALATPFRRRDIRPEMQELRGILDSIPGEAKVDIARAYRRWAGATERLCSPSLRSFIGEDVRRAREGAVRSLQAKGFGAERLPKR